MGFYVGLSLFAVRFKGGIAICDRSPWAAYAQIVGFANSEATRNDAGFGCFCTARFKGGLAVCDRSSWCGYAQIVGFTNSDPTLETRVWIWVLGSSPGLLSRIWAQAETQSSVPEAFQVDSIRVS